MGAIGDHDTKHGGLSVSSPRDHRYSAIWQALTEASRSELLTIARAQDPAPPTEELIADIRRNGGMIAVPPWTDTPAPPIDAIPADFLDWLNRILGPAGT
jgi:hypothetical protein